MTCDYGENTVSFLCVLNHCSLYIFQVLNCEREYLCSKCRHVCTIQADFNQFYTFASPMACTNPGCSSDSFTCLSGGSVPATCKDYQEIKIQEQVGNDVFYFFFSCWDCHFFHVNFVNLLIDWNKFKFLPSYHRYRDCRLVVFLALWWWF